MLMFFSVLLDLQIQNAAEEPRVLCIIQDITSAKMINERLTLNLPASTTLSKLYDDVAHKARYVKATFDLAWGNTPDMVRKLINPSSDFYGDEAVPFNTDLKAIASVFIFLTCFCILYTLLSATL